MWGGEGWRATRSWNGRQVRHLRLHRLWHASMRLHRYWRAAPSTGAELVLAFVHCLTPPSCRPTHPPTHPPTQPTPAGMWWQRLLTPWWWPSSAQSAPQVCSQVHAEGGRAQRDGLRLRRCIARPNPPSQHMDANTTVSSPTPPPPSPIRPPGQPPPAPHTPQDLRRRLLPLHRRRRHPGIL